MRVFFQISDVRCVGVSWCGCLRTLVGKSVGLLVWLWG